MIKKKLKVLLKYQMLFELGLDSFLGNLELSNLSLIFKLKRILIFEFKVSLQFYFYSSDKQVG